MTIVDRAKAPTPKFFRILRSIGLALLAISGTIIAAPVVLPIALVSAAGYVAVAGGVISAISQLTSPLTYEEGILEKDKVLPETQDNIWEDGS